MCVFTCEINRFIDMLMDMKSSSSSSSLEAQASNKDTSEIDDVLISLIDKETEIPPIPPSIYFAGCAYGACFCKFINC